MRSRRTPALPGPDCRDRGKPLGLATETEAYWDSGDWWDYWIKEFCKSFFDVPLSSSQLFFFGVPPPRFFDERLTHSVISAFYEVYNNLGFGFLEYIYGIALERELLARNHIVARQVSVGVSYKGDEIAEQRMDMIVDERLLVEIKSTFELRKAATRQVYNYVRCTNLEVGLLLHFGPQAKVYRIGCPKNKKALSNNPTNPLNPNSLPSR